MRTLFDVRLTNRGRVACGVLVTVVALAGQSAYSALVSGHSAAATRMPVVAARTPTPAASSSSPVAATPSAAALPTSRPTSPSAIMDHNRDDLPPTAGPSVQPSPSPSSGSPEALASGNGRLTTVAGHSGVGGRGPLRRYRVQVEGGIGEDSAAFAAAVQRTLRDTRSWGAQYSFQRVENGPVSFTVVLASPTLAERLCKPTEISYQLSCFSGGASVINLARWRDGAQAYAGNLAAYRQYVVNHEVGHALGHGHEQCPGAGHLAPVMMQQTKGVGACRPNPWPYPGA